MCYSVFIATSTPLSTSEFTPNVTRLYLKIPDDEELSGLSGKFTAPYIYYVGSDTQCSCGFEFHSEFFDHPDWQDSKDSPQALLDLLNNLTVCQNVEYYCCWDGDWADPVEHTRTLNSWETALNENYFKLVEKEFICFQQRSTAQ